VQRTSRNERSNLLVPPKLKSPQPPPLDTRFLWRARARVRVYARQATPETSRKDEPYTRMRTRSHTYVRYYVSQAGAWRSYIRQERRALVATAVFHFALKPRAPRILLIRYIRKLIVIRWSRVYTREPPASRPAIRLSIHPSSPPPSFNHPAHAQSRYTRTPL